MKSGFSEEDAARCIYMFDKDGLVTKVIPVHFSILSKYINLDLNC